MFWPLELLLIDIKNHLPAFSYANYSIPAFLMFYINAEMTQNIRFPLINKGTIKNKGGKEEDLFGRFHATKNNLLKIKSYLYILISMTAGKRVQLKF